MVHALREAHRVLAPAGILVDLRPAAAHRRVAIARGRREHRIGVMRELFHDELAADRAVAHAVREGWFGIERRMRFDCRRVMDTVEEFREWLGEVDTRRAPPSHEWLGRRVERAPGTARGR